MSGSTTEDEPEPDMVVLGTRIEPVMSLDLGDNQNSLDSMEVHAPQGFVGREAEDEFGREDEDEDEADNDNNGNKSCREGEAIAPGSEDGEDEEKAVGRTLSKVTTSGRLKRVPAKQRRGLLSNFSLVPEYEDARDYPDSIKLMIVFIIAFAAVTGPMGTSIMMPAIDDVTRDLNTSDSVVNVSVGVYLLSLGIFPMWWSTFSEKHGRRSIYVISFVLFCGFSIGCALAPNIGALIVLRVLCGGCSASVQAVGAGTIGDLYVPDQRGRSMGLYYLGPLMGPFLAPILGGAVAQAWGWRATQWLLVIFSGINVVLIVFTLPETLRKQDNVTGVRDMLRRQFEQEDESSSMDSTKMDETNVIPPNITNTVENYDFTEAELKSIASNLSRHSSNRRNSAIDEDCPVVDPVMPSLSKLTTNRSTYSRKIVEESNHIPLEDLHRALTEAKEEEARKDLEFHKQSRWKQYRLNAYEYVIRPTHSMILLSYPPVALVVSYSSICFAVIYFFNMTITYEYSRKPYDYSTIIVGLMYIPNSVTYVMASLIGGRWNDHLLREYAKNHNGELVPESRISYNVIVAVVLYVPACLIFGWCLKYGEHWITPLVGTALCGFASMLVIGATVTYLVDLLPGKGATGVALNNLIRMTLAAIAVFIVDPLLKAIGPGVLFSILAGIVTVASGSLIILKKNGQLYREKYDLGKLYDKL